MYCFTRFLYSYRGLSRDSHGKATNFSNKDMDDMCSSALTAYYVVGSERSHERAVTNCSSKKPMNAVCCKLEVAGVRKNRILYIPIDLAMQDSYVHVVKARVPSPSEGTKQTLSNEV